MLTVSSTLTDGSTAPRVSLRCPDCGSRVKRILRSANDKRRWDADQWRRYRCRRATCRWQGLLRVRPDAIGGRSSWRAMSLPARIAHVLLMLVVTAGLIWGGLLALGMLTGG